MKYENLVVLLTCHSLEDFPVHHEGEDADSLLANWTVLWHPKLIAEAGKTPTWIRTYEVPENCAGYLFLSPTTSDSELQTGFARRVNEEGGKLIRRKTRREDILGSIWDGPELAAIASSIDPDLVADFHALGYCYLQIQLLTRQLRYSSNLDEVYFCSLVVQAAEFAVGGQAEQSREKLQACFDLLMEERDNYYPVNALLIDLTLVVESTLDDKLEKQLACTNIQQNYLLTGKVATELAETPLAQALTGALETGNAYLVGGTWSEPRLPLLSLESLIDEFDRGQVAYRTALRQRCDFFGRRRYGLTTSLPQILEHFQFKGAFHFTLDEGRFPEGMQIKSFWEGDGEARVEIFGKIPLDANAPGHFLNLGVKIGESFDMDHSAAICFVHWPGRQCTWYEDLQRISRYGPVLGEFVTAGRFLAEMEEPYQHDHFTPDQYQSPYFKQAVIRNQPDPVSRSIRYWKRSRMLDSIHALQFIDRLLHPESEPGNCRTDRRSLTEAFEGGQPEPPDLDQDLSDCLNETAQRLVNHLVADSSKDDSGAEGPDRSQPDDAAGTGHPVFVVLNPQSQVQRQPVELNLTAGQTVNDEKPLYANSTLDNGAEHAVVDVPAMGFAAVTASATLSRPDRSSKNKSLVDEFVIRNEFMEVVIDQTTGGIRAVHDYKSRGNRLSQVLAFRGRQSAEDEGFQYSRMILDSIETLDNTSTLGRIRTRGHLEFGGKNVAGYEQSFTLFRGSRVLEIACQFDGLQEPAGDPWNNYFGVRFAYGDESSLVSHTINETRHPSIGKRIEAPHYVDLENAKARTTLLTGGIPFHIRRGDRYIDSICIVKGESQRQFRLGVGVDLANPLYQANALVMPTIVVPCRNRPEPSHCWFFHFDSKNIMATHWEPVLENNRPVGFRVRAVETMGRGTKARLSCFREINAARRVRFSGETVDGIPVSEGRAELHFAPNQMLELEVRW